MRILIVGGGIGGLCLAQGLRRENIDVSVFERQIDPLENLAGYGIHINQHGRRALEDCLSTSGWQRFLDVSTHAGTELHFRDERLRRLATRDEAALTGRPASEVELRGVGRIELREILLDGLNSPDRPIVHWGKTFTHYQELEKGGVRAFFQDGSSADGDLLVGADASNSKVRQQYLPHLKRDDLGIVTVAGRYLLDEDKIKALPRALTDGSLNNIVPSGPGWMFVAAWRSRSADVDGKRQEDQSYVTWAYVAPQSRASAVPQDRGALALQDFVLKQIDAWSPELRKIVKGADLKTIAAVPLRSMPHLDPWPASDVTLVGDAIHNMTPMAGMGANTALRDARLLRNLLVDAAARRRSVKDAVRDYESQMRGYANAAVALSRRNSVNASSEAHFPRVMFRFVLRVAQRVPWIMRRMFGSNAKQA